MAKWPRATSFCRFASSLVAASVVALFAAAVSSEFRRCVSREAILGVLLGKMHRPECGFWPDLKSSCPSSFFLGNVLVMDQCLPMDVESRPALPQRAAFLRVLAEKSRAVRQGLASLGLEPAAAVEALSEPSALLRHGWRAAAAVAGREGSGADPRQFPSWWVPGLAASTRWPSELFGEMAPLLERRHPEILGEFLELNRRQGLSGFNLPEWRGERTVQDWKTFHLVDQRGGVIDANVAKVPVTWATVKSIPRVCLNTMAMFSLLMPGSLITAHTGYSNMFLRVHLTIINTQPDLAFIEVGGERFGWKEGKVIIFDDSFWHSAWNDGDAPRVVLFFDIWHPSISDDELPAIQRAYEEYNSSPIMLGRQQEVQAVEAASVASTVRFE